MILPPPRTCNYQQSSNTSGRASFSVHGADPHSFEEADDTVAVGTLDKLPGVVQNFGFLVNMKIEDIRIDPKKTE